MSTTAEQSLTHHVRLIMDNDEGIYLERCELTKRALEDNRPIGNSWGIVSDDDRADARKLAVHDLANSLEHLYRSLVGLEDDFGVAEPSLPASEILSTALAFVDWREMAADYLEEEAE